MEYLTALQTSPLTHPSKPSLFELLSQSQLNSLLPPTLRYLLALLTHRHPRHLLRLLNAFDEVYALLSLVVEKYYLETFGGGFTENFYGLKREKVLRVRGGEVRRAGLAVPGDMRERVGIQHSRKDVWRNLAVMVGVPYLKRKLDEAYDVHIAPANSLIVAGGGGPQYVDRDALPRNPTRRQRWMWCYKWFLRRVYPGVNAAYYFSMLAFSLGYLFDGTKYSTPFLWLVGTRMRRLGEVDYRAFALAAEKGIPGIDNGLGWRSLFDRRILYARLLSSLKILLPTSIFALKFLEWWHASDFSKQLSRKAAEGLELPPPIVSGMRYGRNQEAEIQQRDDRQPGTTSSRAKRDPPISSTSYLLILTVPPPPSSDLCPICLHPVSNPTACQTGYVFDYKCIFQWIEGTHERQGAWMKGEKMSEWEEDDDDGAASAGEGPEGTKRDDDEKPPSSREGRWESGQGRCAITGRRVLGGTSGLRRVMV